MKPITGTFFEFDHPNAVEGQYYNDIMWHFTEEQWRTVVRETAEIGMDTLVLLCSALHFESYYSFDEFPYAKHIACENVMEVLLDEADKNNQKVFLSAGFYGDWTDSVTATTDKTIIERTLHAMNVMSERFGHHQSMRGWYLPDEWQIVGHFDERFIRYINTISAEAHRLNPKSKTMIAPYGTRLATPDDQYIKQLEALDLDIVAYQDEVGVQKTTIEQETLYYEGLFNAHQKAGRAAIWADMEIFTFEDAAYHSALIPASWERVKAQIEALSPFVEKIIAYSYQGMMSKPSSIARCGCPQKAEQLHTDYKQWLETNNCC